MMMKNVSYLEIAKMFDKIMRFLFFLSIILALFFPWYLGVISPDPSELPLSGWFSFIASAFWAQTFITGLLNIGLFTPALLQFIGGTTIVLWCAPVLCLLNLFLATGFRNIVIGINRIFLAISLIAAFSSIVLIKFNDALLFGFWIYFGLLVILFIYEFILYVTIK